MIYSIDITIPPNTARIDAVEQVIHVHPGILRQVDIQFPTGCVGLCRVVICHWGVQVWPLYIEDYLNGNGALISWMDEYSVDETPYEFSVKGWNLDDTYPHTVTVRMVIMSVETLESGNPFKEFLGAMLKGTKTKGLRNARL